jgi:cytochrome b
MTVLAPAETEVRVWDPFVRIFHWGLVASFTVAFVTGEHFERLHFAAGYAVMALIAFRVVWGFVGPRHARFSDFVRLPTKVMVYLGDMARGRATRTLGHNPAGGAMVVALLVMLAITSGTGYALTLPDISRSKWIKELHEISGNATLALAVLHVAGVLVTSVLYRENLVRAMFTGRKRAG